jgi:hypothetical protein
VVVAYLKIPGIRLEELRKPTEILSGYHCLTLSLNSGFPEYKLEIFLLEPTFLIDELWITWKLVMAYFKVLSWHLPGGLRKTMKYFGQDN